MGETCHQFSKSAMTRGSKSFKKFWYVLWNIHCLDPPQSWWKRKKINKKVLFWAFVHVLRNCLNIFPEFLPVASRLIIKNVTWTFFSSFVLETRLVWLSFILDSFCHAFHPRISSLQALMKMKDDQSSHFLSEILFPFLALAKFLSRFSTVEPGRRARP